MSSIIVFGGSRGIGKTIAEHLIKKGHGVSVGSRNPKDLHDFEQVIAMQGLHVKILQADISSEHHVANAFRSHQVEWGRSPDAVINCAAVLGPIGSSWLVPTKRWEETIRINLVGSFIVARAAIEHMAKTGCGSIVMFSGGGAAYGRPNFSAYGVSKTGVLRMVETMAQELKLAGYSNITINALAPGAVKTSMTSEVLEAGPEAGQEELEQAARVFKSGGTSLRQITDLIDFLIDPEANRGLTGRLIHVREDYAGLVKQFGAEVPDDIGKMRRIPIRAET